MGSLRNILVVDGKYCFWSVSVSVLVGFRNDLKTCLQSLGVSCQNLPLDFVR